jgi:hypothetical protein
MTNLLEVLKLNDLNQSFQECNCENWESIGSSRGVNTKIESTWPNWNYPNSYLKTLIFTVWHRQCVAQN